MTRQDGLSPGQPFLVVLLYDKDGFYAALTAPTAPEVQEKATKRMGLVKGIVAATLPFPGAWAGSIPDVSAPADVKAALGPLEGGPRED